MFTTDDLGAPPTSPFFKMGWKYLGRGRYWMHEDNLYEVGAANPTKDPNYPVRLWIYKGDLAAHVPLTCDEIEMAWMSPEKVAKRFDEYRVHGARKPKS